VNILLWPLYPIVLTLSFLTGIVPPRVGYRVAWLMGTLAFVVLPHRRRVIAANYAPVVGKSPSHPDVRRIGQSSFRNYARYIYDVLRLPHCSVEDIDRLVKLNVRDDFVAARQQGKGMIFVSAHFGNMDYTAVALCKNIVPMTAIADAIKPKQLMDRLVAYRGAKGVKMAYQARAPRAAIEALKRNEAVGFLVDVGCSRKGGIPVSFFGRRTMIPAGPALLALRTGAPIVVGYACVVDGRIEAHSYPPIYAAATGDKQADARRCSQMIAGYFEDFIRRYPEQWYIYRPMWQAEPASTPAEGQGVVDPVADGI
jgi:KDO2-lipid IV(A) lauroyltransferase